MAQTAMFAKCLDCLAGGTDTLRKMGITVARTALQTREHVALFAAHVAAQLLMGTHASAVEALLTDDAAPMGGEVLEELLHALAADLEKPNAATCPAVGAGTLGDAGRALAVAPLPLRQRLGECAGGRALREIATDGSRDVAVREAAAGFVGVLIDARGLTKDVSRRYLNPKQRLGFVLLLRNALEGEAIRRASAAAAPLTPVAIDTATTWLLYDELFALLDHVVHGDSASAGGVPTLNASGTFGSGSPVDLGGSMGPFGSRPASASGARRERERDGTAAGAPRVQHHDATSLTALFPSAVEVAGRCPPVVAELLRAALDTLTTLTEHTVPCMTDVRTCDAAAGSPRASPSAPTPATAAGDKDLLLGYLLGAVERALEVLEWDALHERPDEHNHGDGDGAGGNDEDADAESDGWDATSESTDYDESEGDDDDDHGGAASDAASDDVAGGKRGRTGTAGASGTSPAKATPPRPPAHAGEAYRARVRAGRRAAAAVLKIACEAIEALVCCYTIVDADNARHAAGVGAGTGGAPTSKPSTPSSTGGVPRPLTPQTALQYQMHLYQQHAPPAAPAATRMGFPCPVVHDLWSMVMGEDAAEPQQQQQQQDAANCVPGGGSRPASKSADASATGLRRFATDSDTTVAVESCAAIRAVFAMVAGVRTGQALLQEHPVLLDAVTAVQQAGGGVAGAAAAAAGPAAASTAPGHSASTTSLLRVSASHVPSAGAVGAGAGRVLQGIARTLRRVNGAAVEGECEGEATTAFATVRNTALTVLQTVPPQELLACNVRDTFHRALAACMSDVDFDAGGGDAAAVARLAHTHDLTTLFRVACVMQQGSSTDACGSAAPHGHRVTSKVHDILEYLLEALAVGAKVAHPEGSRAPSTGTSTSLAAPPRPTPADCVNNIAHALADAAFTYPLVVVARGTALPELLVTQLAAAAAAGGGDGGGARIYAAGHALARLWGAFPSGLLPYDAARQCILRVKGLLAARDGDGTGKPAAGSGNARMQLGTEGVIAGMAEAVVTSRTALRDLTPIDAAEIVHLLAGWLSMPDPLAPQGGGGGAASRGAATPHAAAAEHLRSDILRIILELLARLTGQAIDSVTLRLCVKAAVPLLAGSGGGGGGIPVLPLASSSFGLDVTGRVLFYCRPRSRKRLSQYLALAVFPRVVQMLRGGRCGGGGAGAGDAVAATTEALVGWFEFMRNAARGLVGTHHDYFDVVNLALLAVGYPLNVPSFARKLLKQRLAEEHGSSGEADEVRASATAPDAISSIDTATWTADGLSESTHSTLADEPLWTSFLSEQTAAGRAVDFDTPRGTLILRVVAMCVAAAIGAGEEPQGHGDRDGDGDGALPSETDFLVKLLADGVAAGDAAAAVGAAWGGTRQKTVYLAVLNELPVDWVAAEQQQAMAVALDDARAAGHDHPAFAKEAAVWRVRQGADAGRVVKEAGAALTSPTPQAIMAAAGQALAVLRVQHDGGPQRRRDCGDGEGRVRCNADDDDNSEDSEGDDDVDVEEEDAPPRTVKDDVATAAEPTRSRANSVRSQPDRAGERAMYRPSSAPLSAAAACAACERMLRALSDTTGVSAACQGVWAAMYEQGTANARAAAAAAAAASTPAGNASGITLVTTLCAGEVDPTASPAHAAIVAVTDLLEHCAWYHPPELFQNVLRPAVRAEAGGGAGAAVAVCVALDVIARLTSRAAAGAAPATAPQDAVYTIAHHAAQIFKTLLDAGRGEASCVRDAAVEHHVAASFARVVAGGADPLIATSVACVCADALRQRIARLASMVGGADGAAGGDADAPAPAQESTPDADEFDADIEAELAAIFSLPAAAPSTSAAAAAPGKAGAVGNGPGASAVAVAADVLPGYRAAHAALRAMPVRSGDGCAVALAEVVGLANDVEGDCGA